MKKNIISIILIFALLFVTACNKEKKDAEESTEPIISDIPTEIPDNDQIKDKKTGAIFGVDSEIKGIQSPSLTDADSVQIILNQSTYYFPFVFSRFDNEGWTYFDNQDKPIENIYEAIDGEESVDIVFRNNDSSFIVKRTGFLAESSGLAGEPIITDIVLQGSGYNASFSWILPGGITEKSTAADVLSIFGDPNNTKHFSSESGNTERSLIYKSGNNTGISYIFNFDVDGRIETVEVSKSDKEIANTVKYSNEFLTIQLPGFWQGRYVVKKEGDDTYQFKFKEGGHLFSIMISETEVYDYSTNSFVIGTLTGNNHHYEVACRFPTDDQAPEGYEYDYNAMNTPLSPSEIFDSIEAADGYTYQTINYTPYLGSYSTGTLETGGYGLEIEETDGSSITFTLGFYSNSKISELEHVEVSMSQGKGRFYYEQDGWGVYCEGYIRLENGKAYFSVNTVDQSGPPSYIQTKGEKELKRTESQNAELSSNKASELIVDQNVGQYLDWTFGDLVDAYGKNYSFDEYHHLQYEGKDIAFQGEHDFETGIDERIYAIIIRGEHDLGNGISSAMTISEIADVFGGTEYPSERSDGGYDLVVYKSDYSYGFIWESDCNQPSDLVYIFDANR